MNFLISFCVGGFLCFIAQILVDKTRLTPARILVGYVCLGVFLTAIGVYEPLVKFASCGATTPLTGFGYMLAVGVRDAVKESGLLGAFKGGISKTACGITCAIFFGYFTGLLFKGKSK